METAVLLLTDVVGSARRWQDEPGPMDAAMVRHHAIVHATVERHGGWRPVDQGEGDAVFAAFRTATAAVACAAEIQHQLAVEHWPTRSPLTVRMGLHLGEVVPRDGNLYGDPVNRCARLRGLGHGGQVLLSSAVYEVVRDALPEGASLRDLGEHRMKDLVRPEHVWQLDLAGLPDAFPPLRSLDVARHNLPVQPGPLIGRDDEVRSVVDLLGRARLVTVAGFGGMGKTRLALQVAAEVADGDGDGVWFVDLSAVDDAAAVPTEIARVLGAREDGRGPEAAVLEAVRDKRLLLVLDNLEQVLDCACFVADLLDAAPQVTVLATSREPLRLRAEQVVNLAPLQLPPVSAQRSEELSAYAAVQLFVERAVAVNSAFEINAANAPAVAQICTALDGHPLAIELAAARTRVLTPDQVLERLGSSLTLLASRARDLPVRHQTLRATIAWSYDALADHDAVLLQRLSVFAGSFDLTAAEAVCGDDLDVLEGLTTLVEKSLVKRVDDRFLLLVSIRAFAAELLQDAEERVLRDRHAAHYLGLLRAVQTEAGLSKEAEALCHQEETQLRQAVAHEQRATAERELAVPLAWFDHLNATAKLAEAEAGLLHAIDRAVEPSLDTVWKLRSLWSICDTSGALGDYWRHADRAVALCRSLSPETDPEVAAALAECLGARFIVETDMDALLRDADEAAALIAATAPHLDPLRREELKAAHASSVASALRWHDPERGLAAARSIDPRWDVEGMVPIRVARLAADLGRTDVALPLIAHVDGPDDVLGHPVAKQWGVDAAATTRYLLGELEAARALAHESIAYTHHIGAWGRRFYPLLLLADLELQVGDLDGCARWLDESSALALQHDATDRLTAVRWRQSRLHRVQGGADPSWDPRPLLDDDHVNLQELVGCLLEAAVWETDPATRDQLVARATALVKGWPLRFGGQDDLERLTSGQATSPLAEKRTVAVPFGPQ